MLTLLSSTRHVNYSQHSEFWHFVSKKCLLIRASASTIIDISQDDPEKQHKLEVPSKYSKKNYSIHYSFTFKYSLLHSHFMEVVQSILFDKAGHLILQYY